MSDRAFGVALDKIDKDIAAYRVQATEKLLPPDQYARQVGIIDGLNRARTHVSNIRRDWARGLELPEVSK